jgi:hypothetical protein
VFENQGVLVGEDATLNITAREECERDGKGWIEYGVVEEVTKGVARQSCSPSQLPGSSRNLAINKSRSGR